MKLLKLLGMLIVFAVIAGCSQTSTSGQPKSEPTATPAAPPTTEPSAQPLPPPEVKPVIPSGADIQILGKGGFEPNEIKIAAGGTITWKVTDKSSHKLHENGVNGFTSPVLKEGETFENTFKDAGTFEIIDVVFGKEMTIVVQ